MKAAVVLLGISLSLAAVAQVRTTNPQPTAPPSQAVARGIQLEDPQITQLRKQIAEMRHDIAELRKQNAGLVACTQELRHDVVELQLPKPAVDYDGVAVPPSQGIGTNNCY